MFSKLKAVFKNMPKERYYSKKISTFMFQNSEMYFDKKQIGKIFKYYEKWVTYTAHRSYPFETEVLYYIMMRLFWSNIEDSGYIRKILLWSEDIHIHFMDFVLPGPGNVLQFVSPDCAMHFAEFFLRSATKRRLMINKVGVEDLLVRRRTKTSHTCEIALASSSPELLLLFLRYGALTMEFSYFYILRLVQQFIQIMLELKRSTFLDSNAMENARCANIIECGMIIMRVCPQLNKRHAFVTRSISFPRDVKSKDSWKWVIDNVLPDLEFRIFQPMALKQMCRLKIRVVLYKKWLLPDGIVKLPLPKYMKNYLDLLHN